MGNLISRGSLDPRWNGHHVEVVKGFMIATINVIRTIAGAKPEYDFDTGKYINDTVETILFEHKARVQPFGIMGNILAAQDATSRRLYRVQIEKKSTGIRQDDIVEIVECDDYPELTYFPMEVRNVSTSSNAWLTDLVCEVDQKGSDA